MLGVLSIRLGPPRLSGPELVAQKIEVDVRVVAAPVHILTETSSFEPSKVVLDLRH
jgi:hypothetical protein